MSSKRSGAGTSRNKREIAGVTSINRNGIWLMVEGNEYFVPFREYKKFLRASVEQICRVEYHPPEHLHWKDLDVDIELGALDHPEKFPLTFQG